MRNVTSVVSVGLFALLLIACHADENDPAGQAGELSDPVRRTNAVGHLTRMYTSKLADHDGDRSHPEVRKIADAMHAELTKAYIDHPEDTQNGQRILDLLKEMRDPRTLPALLKALDWRTEVSEEHAVRAAQTLRSMDVPADQVGEVVGALSKALRKVSDARKVDNRMRVAFLNALGELGDKRATDVLAEVATTQSEEQDFLVNRLAAQQLGKLADPDAVPALVKCLFLFSPNNPGMRMNDVAAEALVRIGRPAYAPLLEVLRGEDEVANAIAEQYIAAIRQRDENAANRMSVEQITSGEATFALGSLGFRDALAPLLEQIGSDDTSRRINAAIAIVRLNHEAADLPKVREAVKAVYGDADVQAKPQLIAAMRHLYDPSLLSLFLAEAKDSDVHPAVRLEAVKAYALLADKSESATLRDFIRREPKSEDGGYREKFAELEPALEMAKECDENVDCWIGKLGESETLLVRKAAYMLGRLGRGNDKAIGALVEQLDHSEIEVRLAAVAALDRAAVRGSDQAVQKIEELRQKEGGRSIWTKFRTEALPIQARLRARASA